MPNNAPTSPKDRSKSFKKLDNEDKDQEAAVEEGEEEKKEAKIRVNHYKEMGLEETSIVRKIASVVGFA